MSESREFDPHDAVDFLYRTAPQYAQAKADRVYMEEFRKSKKAMLMKASGVDAIGAQEREAYASAEYVALLDALRAAVEREETLRWHLIAAQARFDAWRTQEASNRSLEKATR
jgi:hypothetical protein